MDKKIKILWIAESVSLAHIARCLTLSSVLEKNYPVDNILAFDERFSKFVSEKVKSQFLKSISPEVFIERVNQHKFPYTEENLHQYVKADCELISKVKPDIVIGDFRSTLAISARKEKVPYITITNYYWLPSYPGPIPPPNHPVFRPFPLSIATRLFKVLKPFISYREARNFNKVAKDWGSHLRRLLLTELYTEADHTWIVEPQEWFDSNSLTEVSAIGPLEWKPQGESPSWQDRLSNHLPTIYVSVGSTGSKDIIEKVCLACLDLEVQVIISGVEQERLNQFSRPYFFGAPFLSNQDFLKRADLFISNGGSLSMVDGLKFGKPILGLASNYDQILSAYLLKAKNLGWPTLLEGLQVQELKKLIIEGLKPSEKMKKSLFEHQKIFSREPDSVAMWSSIQNLLIKNQ